MAVRTIGELEDVLDGAFSWRRIELSALKGLIEQHESKAGALPTGRSLRRAGIAMLYAHWEGFTKECFQAYLDFLTRRKLRLNELNDGLLQVALLHALRRTESGDGEAKAKLIEAIRRSGDVRLQLPKSQLVNTESNLRSKVLMRMLSDFGLDANVFELKENLIDRRLCDIRNSIAHGRETCPALGEFSQLHSEIIQMMEHLRDLIIRDVRSENYKNTDTSTNRTTL